MCCELQAGTNKKVSTNRTNRKCEALLIQWNAYRCTVAKTNIFDTSLMLLTLKQTAKGSWLRGGNATQPDSDLCAGSRQWCASRRSQEKYDEAYLQVLCVCSQACACARVCSVASSAFHPLSKHNKHRWKCLSSSEKYDANTFIYCVIISLIICNSFYQYPVLFLPYLN